MHHSLFTIVQLPRGGKLEWDEGAQKITMVFSPTKKIVLNTDLKIENVLQRDHLLSFKGSTISGFSRDRVPFDDVLSSEDLQGVGQQKQVFLRR